MREYNNNIKKIEFNKTNFVKIDNESKEEEYLEILCDFFKKLREADR